MANLNNKLIIAISSRALFDLDQSNQIYETQGIEAYAKYQIEHENIPLNPGVAFSLVKKLLAIHSPINQEPLVEVVLLSRNSSDTGLRIFNSIEKHQLNITRAVFCDGRSPYQYANAFGAHLFLSVNGEDVRNALRANVAAATILSSQSFNDNKNELRIAFDGDAVLFSDEAEKIFQQQGLEAFQQNEKQAKELPLSAGPFKGFLEALHNIQKLFAHTQCPIRTALVTARSAPAHERVIKTLRAWGIRIDEALFLGGLNKAQFLKAFKADFYFDDQLGHCNNAREHVVTAHVPHGVVNELE